MPRYKDEQFDDVADIRTLQRQRTKETRPQAQRPRNLPQRGESTREDFYSDEHPEIPITRRASLYLDQYQSSSPLPVLRAREIETEHTRRVPQLQKQKKPYKRKKQDFLPQFVHRQNWLTSIGFATAFLLTFLLLSTLLFHTPVMGFIVIPGLTDMPTDPHQLVIAPPNTDHPSPPVYAQAAYLLDADTGTTFYAHNPFTHLPVMSTTKLMTALLAVEHGNLDQTVTINNQIANDINHLPPDSANIKLKAGESYTLRQLMYGLLLASGNDAAIAIADTVGGSSSNFVAMMNQKAAELGLHDTHFANPHGLQEPNHYSSAHDLAILGLKSLSNPTIRQISGTLNYHIDQSPEHALHDFFNANQFIWWYPDVDAGKTGYDAGTNFVQVISCVRNGHHLIGVTIHTIDWWTDMRNLMNWGSNTYTWVSPHDLNKPDHAIPYADLWNNFSLDQKENTIPTADHGRYYIYTGYSTTGDIQNYFDNNGGLTAFGFPTSQSNDAGNGMLTQRFEHGTIQCNTQNKQCQKGT
jgi:D-alanyl-D-alanine carboxypeptidase